MLDFKVNLSRYMGGVPNVVWGDKLLLIILKIYEILDFYLLR